MADNKNKIDRIHDQMPRFFKTRANPNWSALIGALGESDQNIADLMEEIRKQFFIKTSNRPYIDRLGTNVLVSRPRFIGMDDATFRNYIPVLAYQPKQVKLILDSLLDIFFFKETTTSFSQTINFANFTLLDGWELEYIVDQIYTETILFYASDFSDINNATAEEVVSAINRQTQHSFAVVFDDRITKQKFIRLFTNTIGSKGSIQITGGRANIGINFRGFNTYSGSGNNTVWNIQKVGDTVTYQHVGGISPNLQKIEVGDILISSIPDNSGSFPIQSIDISNNTVTILNPFATPGIYDHNTMSPDAKVRFITPEKIVVYTNNNRSMVWEVSPGEIIIEMPASPPVVRRSLIGSAHMNGMVDSVVSTIDSNRIQINDASEWPNSGQFILQQVEQLQTHVLTNTEDFVDSREFNTRFDVDQKYSYTSKNGNVLEGITPDLPLVAHVHEFNINTAIKVTNTVTVTTTTNHNFVTGDCICVQNTTPDVDDTMNGTFIIDTVPSLNSFTYKTLGLPSSSTGGVCRVERKGMSADGSLVYLTTAIVDTGIKGPYMWSASSAYVISSLTSNIQTDIKAGNIVRTVQLLPNNIPNTDGYVVFDFGTEREEGPVRYLYKPTDNSIQLDPSYVFKNNHDIGSSVTVIRRRGAHVMSGLGKEYPAYITDPSVARATLQELIKQVKSVGIFVEFLIRYPQTLYSHLDLYRSGDPNLWPIDN